MLSDNKIMQIFQYYLTYLFANVSHALWGFFFFLTDVVVVIVVSFEPYSCTDKDTKVLFLIYQTKTKKKKCSTPTYFEIDGSELSKQRII